MSFQRAWIGIALLTAAFAASALANAPDPSEGSELTVEVLGIESDEGQVIAALFDSADGFENSEGPIRQRKATVADRAVAIRWVGLLPGEYALRLVHDRNANGAVDTNWLGLPTEPFGFSNDASSRFGPPGFDAAKFTLGTTPLTLRVTLQEF